eukprot:TRINITY_DN41873_c0_g1_i1.p1 TRINITY_DN41873_c0_g1~~TRINITY_DN41873_c0_g1_i1.p1  ORF type:complete len:526 (-),score=81.40 TRINITY_DN41873_c0_g1_i1:4-1551(-)
MFSFDNECCICASPAERFDFLAKSFSSFGRTDSGDETPMEFPLYALPAQSLLELSSMKPHEEIKSQLVLWNLSMGHLVFISHPWTSFHHPDPTGVQFRVLQDLIRELPSVVRSQREAYMKKTNLAVEGTADFQDLSKVSTWMDYWSIPQTNKSAQLKGIASIPAYVKSATSMFILVPSIDHHDTGVSCDMKSYEKRGWCRLEKLAFFLKDYRKGVRPEIYYVTGDPDRDAQTSTNIIWSPKVSVFNANFTCCDRHHMINGKEVVCDKTVIAPIVGTMFKAACERARRHNDLSLYRKMVAHEWTLYDGLPDNNQVKRFESVKEFLEYYELKDINLCTESGHTALHYATWANDTSAIMRLLLARADLEVKDNDGDTPLCASIFSQSSQSLRCLLRNRANVSDSRAICAAASLDRRWAVESLLDAQADVNGLMPSDNNISVLRDASPLFLASRRGFTDTVALLLQRRADPELPAGEKNPCSSSTSLDVAKSLGHDRVVELLKEATSRRRPVDEVEPVD